MLKKMPDAYRTAPFDDDTVETSIVVLKGRNLLFGGQEGMQLKNVWDGTSNTILAIEAYRVKAGVTSSGKGEGEVTNDSAPFISVKWTEPRDLEIDINSRPMTLKHLDLAAYEAVLADGSPRHIPPKKSVAITRALLTPAAGDDLDSSTFFAQ